eukprot:6056875-Amphidinium_carterae.1
MTGNSDTHSKLHGLHNPPSGRHLEKCMTFATGVTTQASKAPQGKRLKQALLERLGNNICHICSQSRTLSRRIPSKLRAKLKMTWDDMVTAL